MPDNLIYLDPDDPRRWGESPNPHPEDRGDRGPHTPGARIERPGDAWQKRVAAAAAKMDAARAAGGIISPPNPSETVPSLARTAQDERFVPETSDYPLGAETLPSVAETAPQGIIEPSIAARLIARWRRSR